jgi:predicted enzyme related to lactoylglutathione lyase
MEHVRRGRRCRHHRGSGDGSRGTVVSAPADAGPGGRTATCVDPAGADRDASAATAERLGATIVTSAEDLWTKNAVVRDPQGAEFTISQFTPPDGDW